MGANSVKELAEQATVELEKRGYVFSNEPIRIYDETGGISLPNGHAGNWSPGVIRINSAAFKSPSLLPQTIKHELQHEANFRTCKTPLPRWAEEASALNFAQDIDQIDVSRSDIEKLKLKIINDAPFSARDYDTIRSLINSYGWPSKPCAINSKISDLITTSAAMANTPFSHIIIDLTSGRILEQGGNQNTSLPPGSILKIPLTSSMRVEDIKELQKELRASDTSAIQKRIGSIKADLFKAIFNVSDIPKSGPQLLPFLGLRNEQGEFPFKYSLLELALLIREALLLTPAYFSGLNPNDARGPTTLDKANQEDLEFLQEIGAIAKTGTVSDERGSLLLGNLLVAWPAKSPRYLAVFRQGGLRGANLLHPAVNALRKVLRLPVFTLPEVRINLLKEVPTENIEISSKCRAYTTYNQGVELGIFPKGLSGTALTFSHCGDFLIKTHAHAAKAERRVFGRLEIISGSLVLITDPLTYSDGVLETEANGITGEAKLALQAVVVWNSGHGQYRHPETNSVCDTTHCMVYQGNSRKTGMSVSQLDQNLLDLISLLAKGRSDPWLPFSRGGSEAWTTEMSKLQFESLMQLTGVPLSIDRERQKDGAVAYQIVETGPSKEVSCENLMKQLKLVSCPKSIMLKDNTVVFTGEGAGHEQGLNVLRAIQLGDEGKSAESILKDAYAER